MKKRGIAFLLIVMMLMASLGLTTSASADWQRDSKGWWYSYPGGGYARNQWLKLGNTWYAFDSNGYMMTGPYWIDGADYYFDASGAMVTGWQSIDGKWYYYGSSGARQSGWLDKGGYWYYLDPSNNGAMVTGWKTISGVRYYFDGSGAMATGWRKLSDGYWYYFASSGAMATGWTAVNGTYYYFIPHNGRMAYDLTVDGYVLDGSGAWVRTLNSRTLRSNPGSLVFNSSSLKSVTVTYTENGTVTYHVGNENVAYCAWSRSWNGDDTTLYVYPVGKGSTTIYITNNTNNEMITIPVTVY